MAASLKPSLESPSLQLCSVSTYSYHGFAEMEQSASEHISAMGELSVVGLAALMSALTAPLLSTNHNMDLPRNAFLNRQATNGPKRSSAWPMYVLRRDHCAITNSGRSTDMQRGRERLLHITAPTRMARPFR